METIEERAKNYLVKHWYYVNRSADRFNIDLAYRYGATEQRMIDINKLKDVMNILMIDTKVKAEIIKLMEE